MTTPILPVDRELALLLLAGGERMMLAQPQDVVALLDFLEDPDLGITDEVTA